MGLIGSFHIERVGLIGRCHIEGVGLIGRCRLEGMGLNKVQVCVICHDMSYTDIEGVGLVHNTHM
jgi:hypothetical protein